MYFRVVTDRIDVLARDLDSLAASFEAVAERRQPYAGYADARAVEDGLGEFFGKWTDGMGKLHEQLTTLATALHGAVAAYEGTDRSIADGASGQGG